MILRLYSLYDEKTEIFHPPYFCHNAGHAVRTFSELFSRPGTTVNRHPGDFTLYETGEFDDSTGKIESHPVPVLVGKMSHILGPCGPIRKEDVSDEVDPEDDNVVGETGG